MKIKFKAFYYSITTDDVIQKTFYAETMEEAYKIARRGIPKYCEESFDLYMNTAMVINATVEDVLGNEKVIY